MNVVVHYEHPNKQIETMEMSQEINKYELQHGTNSTKTSEHLTSNHADDSINDDNNESAEAAFETGKSPIHIYNLSKCKRVSRVNKLLGSFVLY